MMCGKDDDPSEQDKPSVNDTLTENWPMVEEFSDQEWKLLAMVLVENRGGINLEAGLTPYGKALLASVQVKIAARVLGV